MGEVPRDPTYGGLDEGSLNTVWNLSKLLGACHCC